MAWKTMFASRKRPCTSTITDERLRAAVDRFYDFQEKLRYLDAALRTSVKDQRRALASHALVVDALSAATENSPVFALVGERLNGKLSPVTYVALQAKVEREKSRLLKCYEDEIAKYVTVWEKTVSTRVMSELKHTHSLYRKMVKYHGKVNSLTTSEQKKKKKTKKVDLEKIEKLNWNESKLRVAKKEYRRNLITLTLFTEEITDRGFKDIIPLMIRAIDLDIRYACDDAMMELAEQLSHVGDDLIEMGDNFGMDSKAMRNGRLRILHEEDAEKLVDPKEFGSLEKSTQVRVVPISCSSCSSSLQSSCESMSKREAREEQKAPEETKRCAEKNLSSCESEPNGEGKEEQKALGETKRCPPPSIVNENEQRNGDANEAPKEIIDSFKINSCNNSSSRSQNYPKDIACMERTHICDDETTLTGDWFDMGSV